MPRYIDADVILTKFDKTLQLAGNDGAIAALKFCKEIVRKAPTISTDDLRGVGRWVRISGFHLDHEYHPARYQCDQCKHFVDSGDDRNYCPNCGAKMEVSEDG